MNGNLDGRLWPLLAPLLPTAQGGEPAALAQPAQVQALDIQTLARSLPWKAMFHLTTRGIASQGSGCSGVC